MNPLFRYGNPTPLEALEGAILTGYAYNTGRLRNPGAVIDRMRGPEREAIQALTSKDMLNVIVPGWFYKDGQGPRRRGRFNAA
jgi:hypothetical protein